MDETQETIADIVAAMREIAKEPECVAPTGLNHLADRIEDAAKREREEVEAAYRSLLSDAVMAGKIGVDGRPVGNAAAMREALEKIASYPVVDENCECPECVRQREIRTIARAALSAPPRNCDVGTVEEQEKRFDAYCAKQGSCQRCKDCVALEWRDTNDPWRRVLQWAQMPYEEGGAK